MRSLSGSARARSATSGDPNHGHTEAQTPPDQRQWTLSPGVYAKDVILHIIRKLGVNGGLGFAYEYAGTTFEEFSQEERMTVCNMSLRAERAPDTSIRMTTTFAYLKGRPYAPSDDEWPEAVGALALFCFRSGRNLRRRRHL